MDEKLPHCIWKSLEQNQNHNALHNVWLKWPKVLENYRIALDFNQKGHFQRFYFEGGLEQCATAVAWRGIANAHCKHCREENHYVMRSSSLVAFFCQLWNNQSQIVKCKIRWRLDIEIRHFGLVQQYFQIYHHFPPWKHSIAQITETRISIAFVVKSSV